MFLKRRKTVLKRLEKIRKPFKSSFRVCTPLQFLENNWCGLPWIWHNCNWLISGTRPGRFSVWTLVHTKFTKSEIIFGFALKNTKKVTCWEFKEIRWLKIKTKFVAPFNLRALLHVVFNEKIMQDESHTYLQMSAGYKPEPITWPRIHQTWAKCKLLSPKMPTKWFLFLQKNYRPFLVVFWSYM